MRATIPTLAGLMVVVALLPGCGKDDTPTEPPALAEFTSDAGTLALWHMNEGTGQQVANEAGATRTLSLGSNATVESADPAWSSPGFNGTGSALTFDDAQSKYTRAGDGFVFPGNDFSIEFLVRLSYSDNKPLVFGTNNVSIYIWIRPTGGVQFDIGNGTNWGTSTISPASIVDGAWHYVACTYDHAATRLYIDGVLVATTVQVVDVGDPTIVYVGGRPANTFLRGEMDEVRISAVARTLSEIEAFQNLR